ncbi:MAG: hypothetical protein IK990_04860 [Ruminiclostridium sp.]|nr:hypothetical protein [Ruminiclostridium sp.]
MKKRIIKMVSLLLAASITLTSCSVNPLDPFGFFSNKDDEGDKKGETTTKKEENSGFLDGILGIFGNNKQTGLRESTVSKEDLTNVSNEPYNYNGSEGKYTGEWYEGHPEGEGKFFVSNDEYCDGQWVDGKPCGDVKLCLPRGEGAYMRYEGVYADNEPCGVGYMEYGYSDDQGWGYVKGDFSDKSSLRWYSFNEDNFPVDMGVYSSNGEKISYTEEKGVTGVDFEKPENIPVLFSPTIESVYESDNWKYALYYSGKFYGPTDEDGLPNGLGYYSASEKWYNKYVNSEGTFYQEDYYNGEFGSDYTIESYEEDYKDTECILVNVRCFGNWEHGKLIGKHFLTYYLPDTGEVIKQKYTEVNEEGEHTGIYTEVTMTNKYNTSYVSAELRGLAKSRCKMIIKKHDMDSEAADLKNYKKGSDGYYKSGDYETIEYYEDGTVGYFWYYYTITDTAEYEKLRNSGKNFWIDPVCVGVYYIYDENGNVVEQGQAYRGVWRDDEFIENNERMEAQKAKRDALYLGIFIGLLAVGTGIIVADAKNFNDKVDAYNKAVQAHQENEYKYNQLIDQADSAVSSGNYSEAERLYKEASDIPIITVPSLF